MDISMFARRNYCLTPSRTLSQPFFPCQTVFPLSLNLPFLLFSLLYSLIIGEFFSCKLPCSSGLRVGIHSFRTPRQTLRRLIPSRLHPHLRSPLLSTYASFLLNVCLLLDSRKRADKIVTISPINRHHPSPSSLVEHG
ncbi:hypothetical protein DTO027B5_2613 [Paecilomyces variotii]|nr:hypothetical protein DTO027B3_4160 [Paecilomyces variotii]KAJ9335750.1 hypothetical protein DTO027B5_2613 [Paecilomyces variotii]